MNCVVKNGARKGWVGGRGEQENIQDRNSKKQEIAGKLLPCIAEASIGAHVMGIEATEGNKTKSWRVFTSWLGNLILPWGTRLCQSQSCVSNLIDRSGSEIKEDTSLSWQEWR